MSHNEAMKGLSIELRGVECIIPVLWATDKPSHDMIDKPPFSPLFNPLLIPSLNDFCIKLQSEMVKSISFTLNLFIYDISYLSEVSAGRKEENFNTS